MATDPDRNPVIQELNPADIYLRQKFDEEIVKQGERLDDLAKQMFTLVLAIPGLYATVLKLVAGLKATVGQEPLVWAAFAFWFLALLATMVSLFPRRYRVDRDTIRGRSSGEEISIEEFYRRSADNKRRALLLAAFCFFAGIVFAGITIF